ncbi:lytic transglycosylase domain-containing protein [Hydrogenothermus marinus]|uniref:Soluble lytic murein transglycosylase n=1 Tax=Hydrogenothermus marinus TaxID=133270 RepID=A0A3M0BKW0_9AQUI|nr:lytic transglycosylase domain-containing protein [Hydrogenothermus marinus]RMA96989.1 soluble lytic murein transglycosylase [Hydrogenothermus marinus]
MRLILAILVFIFSAKAESFKDCYKLFKEERFLKAKKCFLSVNDKDLKPYINHYLMLINQIYNEDFKIKDSAYAIKSYDYLKLSADSFYRKEFQKSKNYFQKIDIKALDKDDIPFYLYLKANLYNDFSIKKQLATEYIYDRNYGYKTFLEIYKNLSQKDLEKAVKTLISYRMYERALGIMPLLKTNDKVLYYYLYLYVKTEDFEKAKSFLEKINKKSKYYPVALYILGYYSKSWEERKRYFDKLVETKNKKYINKLGIPLTKKAFHYKKLNYFNYFLSKLDKSEDKVWYTFLYKYFFDSKKKAYSYLLKNTNWIKDKNKLYYWLYLASGNKHYIMRVKNSKIDDFYKIIAGGNVSVRRNIRICKGIPYIEKIKEVDYNLAYIESKYLLKKGKIKNLYCTMPEVVVRKLPKKERFIKPFGNLKDLIYAVMKQESLFYYKAISYSNAVGLMQFIPPTAYWVAKKRDIKNFDITDLFNPDISIDFGRWYLKYLLDKFNGNIYYAIASYNGGATNVSRTLRRFKPKNIAEFVETHPFDETRDYLKKVYTNYVIYRKLNGVSYVYRSNRRSR